MPSYGVTPAGFVVKPLAIILSDMQADVLATIDPQYDVSPQTPDGQMLGIVANELSSLWELAQIVYNAFNRSAAEGAALDNLGDLTGTPREGATFTQVYCLLALAPGTYAASTWDGDNLESGTLVANVAGNTQLQFANVNTLVVPSLPGTVALNAGLNPNLATFSEPVDVPTGTVLIFASQPGVPYVVSAGGSATTACFFTPPYSGPTATATTTTVGTVALMQAATAGVTPTINPGTLTEITSPVTGWATITNPSAQSQLGTDDEPDAAYAVRQAQDLAGEGTCTPSAVVAALNELGAAQTPPVVLTSLVVENTSAASATIDGVTLPPHSYEVIVYDGGTGWATTPVANGGGQELVAAAIYANKPAGISPQGSVSVTIQDPNLGQVTVSYSVPTGVPLYITATVALRAGVSWSQIQVAIFNALISAAVAPTLADGEPPAGQLLPGSPVIGSQLSAVIMSVPGVLDVQSLAFDVHAGPTNTAPITLPATSIATILAGAPGNVVLIEGTGP